ncbi:MAG: glycosyltransferase family 2 protein [Candidatus Omnitrophica bacterium]|nr:glycosyltransferase family 2 protein [Candidatus Omnitrophota bacterium]
MNTKCDIILLSYENPDLLKKCVKSVLTNTVVSSRLIIVDNASKDKEVRPYLESLKNTDKIRIELVFNEKNAGFAGGINKGIHFSSAPFICILNNDCIVHSGWLEEMISISENKENVGLVNPQSNTFGCRDASSTLTKKGEFVELGHAIGFACLIKRQVIECIGNLDEVYEGVCYEDTDFSSRAQKAGFISVMAEGAYVFHLEQASRKGLKNKKMIYSRNKEIYEKRWGKMLRLLALGEISGKEVSDDYEIFKNLARQRTIVDMWRTGDKNIKGFISDMKGTGIIKHADVGIKIFNGDIPRSFVLWKVLTKKKKYDAVIMKKNMVSKVLRITRVFHKTDIFFAAGGTKIESRDGKVFDLNNTAPFAEYLRSR